MQFKDLFPIQQIGILCNILNATKEIDPQEGLEWSESLLDTCSILTNLEHSTSKTMLKDIFPQRLLFTADELTSEEVRLSFRYANRETNQKYQSIPYSAFSLEFILQGDMVVALNDLLTWLQPVAKAEATVRPVTQLLRDLLNQVSIVKEIPEETIDEMYVSENALLINKHLLKETVKAIKPILGQEHDKPISAYVLFKNIVFHRNKDLKDGYVRFSLGARLANHIEVTWTQPTKFTLENLDNTVILASHRIGNYDSPQEVLGALKEQCYNKVTDENKASLEPILDTAFEYLYIALVETIAELIPW